jgi:hypothetical protein
MTITGSTITGNSANIGGGIVTDGTGSATITGSTISSNTSTDGAGIAEEGGGPVTIDRTTISGNQGTAISNGGGLTEDGGGTITITRSTIEDNSARNGGGVAQEGVGVVSVSQSTIDGNTAMYGGGFAQEGGEPSGSAPAFELVNDTITANQATATDFGGGGVLGDGSGTVVLVNSTVASNTAAAGLGGDLQAAGSVIDLTNTIVSGGTPVDCVGSTLFSGGTHGHGTAAGHNLASDSTCSLSTTNADLFPDDPQLGPLADNGGPTKTMPLQAGSPAIGTANTSSCPPTDERGIPRGQTVGAVCDIGAYEIAPPRATSTAVSCAPNPVQAGSPTQCTVTVTDTDTGTPTDPTGTVTLGGGSCALSTGAAAGAAGCVVAYTPVSAGAQVVSASYPGDTTHGPSSGGTSLMVTPPATLRPTTTSIVSCTQQGVIAPTTICTVTVTDIGPAPTFTPTGSVEFFAGHGGTGEGSCTLAPAAAPGSSSCSTGPGSIGPVDLVYAVYEGDGIHALSTSSSVVLVHTMITSGPNGFTSAAPQFTFTASVPGATFQCSLDNGPFVPCVSGVIYYGLAYGTHVFRVRASANGSTDLNGDGRTFTLGTSTQTFGCTLAVPSYHGPLVPFGVDPQSECEYQVTCPALSSCAVSVISVNADDQQVGYAMVENGIGRAAALCATNGDTNGLWLACPVNKPPAAAVRFVSPLSATCDAGHEIVPTEDADGVGQVTCKMTVTVSPLVPLGVIGIPKGGGVTVFVPGPGMLFASLLGTAAADTPAAAASTGKRHGRGGPAPAVRPIRLVVKRAGPVTIPIRLKPPAAARLRQRHRLTIALRLTFAPGNGPRITQLDHVTLTTPACTHARLPHTHGKPITVCR